MKGAMGLHSGPTRGFGDLAASAATEELAYRALPAVVATATGRSAPKGLGALVFAAHHLMDDQRYGVAHTLGGGLGRFADVFLGGLLYEDAYRSYGVLGAIAAHVTHNLAVQFGTSSSRKAPRATSKNFGRCRPSSRRR
jgi:hypothetical protein